ncbi:MAG TPA: 50S ribosomal protein L10, partial [Clostridiales bacterium]|nr:50S ribosomal protein L10 [Clostridiales bacterium]
MSANKEDKKQIVESIKAKITDSKSVLFVDYKGLTVVQDTELRTAFRKNGVEYKVLKNTLVRKAFNALGVNDFDSILNGPTAVAFG